MKSIYISQVFAALSLFITPSSSWMFFTTIRDLTLDNSKPQEYVLHSEYFYGQCKFRKELQFYAHLHFDHIELLGKVIVRGWVDFHRIPTCIMLRATALEYDQFRATSYNFQICVPRITYCHSKLRVKFFYYEWYLPLDFIGGMNWDMYFFGPESASW